MRKIICDNCREYEILKWCECKPSDTFLEFNNTFFALSFLYRLGNDPINMINIRHAVRESYGFINTSAMTDHEILQKFAEQMVHRHIKLIPKDGLIKRGGGFGGSSRTVEGQRDEAEVTKREGTSQQVGGRTSVDQRRDERAGVDLVSSVASQVNNVNPATISPSRTSPVAETASIESTNIEVEVEKSWIEILLVDESDQPVTGERYQLALPNGRIVAQGFTNAQGLVRITGIDQGTYQLTFLSLNEDVWERI